MSDKNDTVTEAEVRRAVARALRKLDRDISSEPSLVLEAHEQSEGAEPVFKRVRQWLFQRRR